MFFWEIFDIFRASNLEVAIAGPFFEKQSPGTVLQKCSELL